VDLTLSKVSADAVVNVTGDATLNVGVPTAFIGDTLTINLADHANLFGSVGVGIHDGLRISGSEGARFHNHATSGVGGANLVIDTDVVGSGTFDVASGFFRGPLGAGLEFGGFVSAGQTVNVSGALGGAAQLKIDHPTQFHGTVDLHTDFSSFADLVGLAQADSWSYKNDLLSIKTACSKVIDRLHVVSDASGSVHGLLVSKTAAGDLLISPGTDFYGSLVLPST
jgi:hypothetical protein